MTRIATRFIYLKNGKHYLISNYFNIQTCQFYALTAKNESENDFALFNKKFENIKGHCQ